MAALKSTGATALVLLTASALLGQPATQTFHLTTVSNNVAALNEISTSVNDIAQAIRSEAMPVKLRIFTCTPHRAVALRGTSDVIAIADRVVEQRDASTAP